MDAMVELQGAEFIALATSENVAIATTLPIRDTSTSDAFLSGISCVYVYALK